MRHRTLAGLLAALTGWAAAPAPPDADRFWGQWRGPRMDGAALHGNPPVEWSETKNVRWKVPLPGLGSSTPVVWGDRLYVLTAIPVGGSEPTAAQEFTVLAVNRADGGIAWKRTARKEAPHEGKHKTNSFASGSAIVDGAHVIAYFGSRGLFCYTLDGRLVWEKDLGDMQTRNGFGEGTSPALSGDTIVITWDHEGADFVVALDKKTGKELLAA